MLISNRAMKRLVEAGYDVNEVLEEVDRIVEDVNALAAELKLMAALVERL